MPRDPEKQRLAQHRYYERNRDIYRDRNRRKRERMRALIREIKSKPCMDCGGVFPYYVMDFHHRLRCEKLEQVANLVSRQSMRRLLDEIEKCDVVCANCHRIRTYAKECSGIV